MRCINTFREDMCIAGVHLYKNRQIALTKNGKGCGNLIMQDKTGTIDAKMRDLGSPGIGEFETMDYVHMEVDVTLFRSSFQLNVRRICKVQEGEYVEAGYLPVSKKDIKKIYEELLGHIRSVKSPYLQKLLGGYFVENAAFAKTFQFHSTAKTVRHGFVNGLLEHTLSVTKLCDYHVGYCSMISRDLLLTTAIFHDVGKTRGLSCSPRNDHTDNGQLLDHIIIGIEMVGESIRSMPGLPEELAIELKYHIPAHHGELEYGSPKKPTPLEALVFNFVDSTDAKMETIIEALQSGGENKGWLGYNRLLESSIRRTTEQVLRLDNIGK